MVLRRSDRAFYVAVAVLVAVAGLAFAFTPGPSATRNLDDWYVGSWRIAAPMVGMQQGRLAQRPAAPAGLIQVSLDKHGLSLSMHGFPGVSSAVVRGQRSPLAGIFETPNSGQGEGNWALALRSPSVGMLSFYDPYTDHWSDQIVLARQ